VLYLVGYINSKLCHHLSIGFRAPYRKSSPAAGLANLGILIANNDSRKITTDLRRMGYAQSGASPE
jgi:hypothetical protein